MDGSYDCYAWPPEERPLLRFHVFAPNQGDSFFAMVYFVHVATRDWEYDLLRSPGRTFESDCRDLYNLIDDEENTPLAVLLMGESVPAGLTWYRCTNVLY
jgi:hypothetical protein